jgi:hypothetical protein
MTDLNLLFSRLSRAKRWVPLTRFRGGNLDPTTAMDVQEAAQSQLDRIYARGGSYSNDKATFRRIFENTARILAQQQLERMEEVYAAIRTSYLSGNDADRKLDALMAALRSWLPWVSYAPFVYLNARDRLSFANSLPESPREPELPEIPEPPDDDIDDDVDGFAHLDRRREEEERNHTIALRNLAAWTEWRNDTQPLANSPRQVAKLARNEPSEGMLKNRLYAEHPILLLFPHVTTPDGLLQVLALNGTERREALAQKVRQASQHLYPTILNFRREIRRSNGDGVEWHRFRPILESAKYILCGEPSSKPVIHSIADGFISDMEGWTWNDVVTGIAIVSSLVLVAVTAGTSLPATAAFWAGVGVDVTAVGLSTYLNHAENERTQALNRFSQVDAALQIASPPVSLSREALFTAFSYLIPIGIGQAARHLTRRAVLRQAAVTVGREVVEETITAARHLTSAADDVAPITRQGENASLTTVTNQGTSPLQRATPPISQATRTASQVADPVLTRQLSEIDDEIGRMFNETFDLSLEVPMAVGRIPPLRRFALSSVQQQNLGELLGRVWTESGTSAAAAMRQRIRNIWDVALPRRGNQSLAEAALAVLNRMVRLTPNKLRGSLNQWVRSRFFNLWRRRFITRIARDPQLIQDLEQQFGIRFVRRPGEGGNAFSVPGVNRSGQVVNIGLDIDHAAIRHEDAVREAIRTNSSRHLESIVSPSNLQFMSARENQNVIESLRAALGRMGTLVE